MFKTASMSYNASKIPYFITGLSLKFPENQSDSELLITLQKALDKFTVTNTGDVDKFFKIFSIVHYRNILPESKIIEIVSYAIDSDSNNYRHKEKAYFLKKLSQVDSSIPFIHAVSKAFVHTLSPNRTVALFLLEALPEWIISHTDPSDNIEEYYHKILALFDEVVNTVKVLDTRRTTLLLNHHIIDKIQNERIFEVNNIPISIWLELNEIRK